VPLSVAAGESAGKSLGAGWLFRVAAFLALTIVPPG
jgi:hypothetical protein